MGLLLPGLGVPRHSKSGGVTITAPPGPPLTLSWVLIFRGGTYDFSEYLCVDGSGNLAELSRTRPDLRIAGV